MTLPKGVAVAGIVVARDTIDYRTATAIIELRTAFDKVQHVQQFLVNNPVVNNIDPLVANYNYSVDDAYAMRLVFQTFSQLRIDQNGMFVTASKFTGLE